MIQTSSRLTKTNNTHPPNQTTHMEWERIDPNWGEGTMETKRPKNIHP